MDYSTTKISDLAVRLDVDSRALMALVKKESSKGFFVNGKPPILFEGHVFWKRLFAHGLNPQDYTIDDKYRDILHLKWDRSFYNQDQYKRLEKAKTIHEDAALESASYGAFQIMGFNYKICGFSKVKDFVSTQSTKDGQIETFAKFIKNDKGGATLNALRKKNWKRFAELYNGPEHTKNNYVQQIKKHFELISSAEEGTTQLKEP